MDGRSGAWQPRRVSSFAEHWTLDPSVTFLNHGSFGACPKRVLDAQSELRAAMERAPVQFLDEQLPARLDAARAKVAALLGADPADLVFTSNVSEGVSVVMRSLPLRAGDEVLVTDHGYRACNNAVRYACERAAAVVRVARVPFPLDDEERVVAAVVEALTPRTRLAVLDHVTSITGLVWPIARLVRELSARGVDTLIDGAHAPGMVEVDLASLGATYYAANFHKWCCAPKGAGALWVRPEQQPLVFPSVISHGLDAPESQRFRAMFDWTGTRDPTAWLCVPLALETLGALLPGGLGELRDRNRALALRAQRLLSDALAIDPPAPPSMIGSLASLPLPLAARRSQGSQLDLYYRLRDRGFEVLVQPWPDERQTVLRVSAQLYNDESQYQALAAALVAELRAA